MVSPARRVLKTSLFSTLLVAAALGLSACSEKKAETAEEVVRPVKVVEVAASQTQRTLNYSGAVRARSEIAMGFRVSGKITERLVDIGDRVTPGEIVARIDGTDYILSVRSAEASLAAAERQVETADLALKRAQQLFDKNVAPKSQLEQAQLSYNQAVSTRDAAVSTLDQARNQVAYGELRADRSGIVTAVNAEAGQVVSTGTPVVTVAVDGEKEVQVAVPETDIFAFKPGKTVNVSIWSNAGLNLTGKVREVAGSADPRSRTFAVRVSLPNDERVLLGMTASVAASAETGPSLVSVPLSALAKEGEGTLVWTVDRQNETVHARPVKVADFNDKDARITDGLKPGDLVVVAGTQFMREDLKVKLPSGSEPQQSALADGDAIPQVR
ncbi:MULTISPECIES: efflux RND transporter periplasmic adaptor subunit [unclassified Rhizobium]|uniref:efflux RND transporter periplasmic adaptor subunit n=1 Tax=unclassified Rhizobium TaxID=2613769 RepID=UPI0006F7AD12|nr:MULTISPECIES: efflux RND transporter periplasmic adaptor subunit [unclassified Rhizobium]KQV43931.1 hemolysin secretion protein D [Rhizobium sp. Root1212]KRD38112.1 hemolysin secretion protein D [Rhizobium sp. Root268]